jgi:hypothetical protein
MTPVTLFHIYLILLALSFSISMIKFKKVDRASKLICLLLGMTLLSEAIGYIVAKYYRNNMPVYHFFNPIELFIVSLYFNASIKTFQKRNIGIYIGIMGVVVSAINTLFFQPLHTLNSYFLLFEGFCIICMSLFSFRAMFDDEQMDPVQNPHFWFSAILLLISGITYTNWALFPILGAKMVSILPPLTFILILISIVNYTAFGLVFLLLPQKKQNEL